MTQASHGSRRGASPPRDSFQAAWRDRFQEFAEKRDDDAGIAGWSVSGLDARVRRFAGAFERPRTDSLWLDAGCGAGTYSRLLSELGAAVVAVDYSPLAVLKARTREVTSCVWGVCDVTQLPFRRDSFDGVLCFGVTQALSSSVAAVRELAAVLRPGGELWIDGLNSYCLPSVATQLRRWILGRPLHLRYERPRAMVRVLEGVGLRDVKVYWMPIAPGRWRLVQCMLESASCRALFRVLPGLGLLLSHSFLVRATK